MSCSLRSAVTDISVMPQCLSSSATGQRSEIMAQATEERRLTQPPNGSNRLEKYEPIPVTFLTSVVDVGRMTDIVLIGGIAYIALTVGIIAGMWKTFEKAGEPGWGAIIPVYNLYLMFKIGDKPWYWLLGLMVPFVNLYVLLKSQYDAAKNFGIGSTAIVFALFAPVSYVVTAFGSYEYKGR